MSARAISSRRIFRPLRRPSHRRLRRIDDERCIRLRGVRRRGCVSCELGVLLDHRRRRRRDSDLRMHAASRELSHVRLREDAHHEQQRMRVQRQRRRAHRELQTFLRFKKNTGEEWMKGGRDLSFTHPSAVVSPHDPSFVPRPFAPNCVHHTSIYVYLAHLSPNWTDGP